MTFRNEVPVTAFPLSVFGGDGAFASVNEVPVTAFPETVEWRYSSL